MMIHTHALDRGGQGVAGPLDRWPSRRDGSLHVAGCVPRASACFVDAFTARCLLLLLLRARPVAQTHSGLTAAAARSDP